MKTRSILVTAFAAAFQINASNVTGTLTVAGKDLPLTFACAYEEQDPFDEKAVRTVLVVSPAAPQIAGQPCRASRKQIEERVQGGGAPALIAYVVPAQNTWTHGNLLAKGENYMYSFAGTDPVTKFDSAPAADKTMLSGRLWTKGEAKMMSFPAMKVDAKISLAPEKMAARGAEITGDAARKHPAVAAARKFLEAMGKGNQAEVRAMIVESERAQYDKMSSSGDKAAMLDMMKEMSKEVLASPDVRVATQGPLTEVIFERKSESGKGRTNFYLLQEKGEWRITQRRS